MEGDKFLRFEVKDGQTLAVFNDGLVAQQLKLTKDECQKRLDDLIAEQKPFDQTKLALSNWPTKSFHRNFPGVWMKHIRGSKL